VTTTATTPPDQDAAAEWEDPLLGDAADALHVDLHGFAGPLDLLLALARTHKLDIAKISMVELAGQYLAFINAARQLHLEVAADYLVMAAWLAYLKSRLLLPQAAEAGDPPPHELAARLAFRLQRLEAMRQAAQSLMSRPRLGREVFARGMPEGVRTVRETQWSAQLFDLLKAYAEQRKRTIKHVHVVPPRTVWSIKEARGRLEALLGIVPGSWSRLDRYIEEYLAAPDLTRTVLASSLGASLEMARDGLVELYQEAPFAPIYVRKREQSLPANGPAE
jgi:segregation and condensation protein A